MRSLIVALAFLLLVALVATGQEPATVPTWQECVDQPWKTADYPGWKEDDAPVTMDDVNAVQTDDEFRDVMRRLLRQMDEQNAEIARLSRELKEVRDQQRAH